MVDSQVAKALVDLVLFLEMSGDDILDPDAAVGAMEALAHNLQLAPAEVQKDLARQFGSLAAEYSEQEEFVAELPGALGLNQ